MSATQAAAIRDVRATHRWLVNGDRLAELAKEATGSDTDTAAAAWLGMDRSMYSRIKRNLVRPNSETMLNVADRLGVAVEEIFQKATRP